MSGVKAVGAGAAISHVASPSYRSDYTHAFFFRAAFDQLGSNPGLVFLHSLSDAGAGGFHDAHDQVWVVFSGDVDPTSSLRLEATNDAGSGPGVGAGNARITDGLWYFLAIVRRGSVLEAWISPADGSTPPVLDATVTLPTYNTRLDSDHLGVGSFPQVEEFDGLLWFSVTGRKLWTKALDEEGLRKESLQKSPVDLDQIWAHWLTANKADVADHSANGRPWKWVQDAAEAPLDPSTSPVVGDEADTTIDTAVPDGTPGEDPEAADGITLDKPAVAAIRAAQVAPTFQPLWDRLGLLLPLTEGTGDPVDVVTGKRCPLDGAAWATVAALLGLTFDGVDDFVQLPHSVLNQRQAYTLLFVARVPDLPNDQNLGLTVFCDDDDGGTNYLQVDLEWRDHTLRLNPDRWNQQGDGSVWQQMFSRWTVTYDHAWHAYLVTQRDMQHSRLGYDGASQDHDADYVESEPAPDALEPYSAARLGLTNAGFAPYLGSLAMVAVWTRELTQAEVELITADPFGLIRVASAEPALLLSSRDPTVATYQLQKPARDTYNVDVFRTGGQELWYDGGAVVNAAGAVLVIGPGVTQLDAIGPNYVERDANGIVSANTSGFTTGRVPLYLVTMVNSAVSAIRDMRLVP